MIAALLLAAAGLGAAEAKAPPVREAVVTASVENLYSGPDDARDVVSQATLGEVVELLESAKSFARIRTPDHYSGWIPLSAVAEYRDGSERRYARAGKVVEVTSLVANVYREPSVTSARPKALAPLAARLEAQDTPSPSGWVVLRLPNGEPGYIQEGDVKSVDPAAPRARGSREEIVATARRYLGTPYLWGGMTARGIDCSGLASRSYHANGIELLRDADLQFADPNADPVARDALLPGDLVFFGRDAKTITHVGLYVGGERFISATTHEVPSVHEDRLDDPYWSAIYQGARRPR